MTATLHDATALHDQDQISVTHGGQPVGDHQRGAPLQRRRQRALDGSLVLTVQVRGGLVQYDDTWSFEQQTGNGKTLLLATR